jgi:hypothetical protein
MPLEKTYEELLASKINARNYSNILPVIYNLRKRERKDYFPVAPQRIIYNAGAVGDGTTADFTAIKNASDVVTSSFARGSVIKLTGTATYILTDGTTNITKPAINIIAQIDMGIQNEQKNLVPRQISAEQADISSAGVFTIIIPADITEKLSVGTHYVYIDAASPDSNPVRLTFSGAEEDPKKELYRTRSFTITA